MRLEEDRFERRGPTGRGEGDPSSAPPSPSPDERVAPKPRTLLPLVLFIATIFTTYHAVGGGVAGAQFSATLLSILVAHEMGHYLVARRHRVEASLPHFIPMPFFFMLGTLGAVIGMRTDQASRNELMDIGAAGPIAGFIVAVPAMAIGVMVSEVVPLKPTILEYFAMIDPSAPLSMAWTAMSFVLPAADLPQAFYGDSMLSRMMIQLLRPPLPEGYDLIAHPILLAAWGGFLVTAINLLPMGQLDGGHVLFAWSPERAEVWARRVYWALIAWGCVGLAVHGPILVHGILEAIGALVSNMVANSVGPDLAERAVRAAGLSGSILPRSLFEGLRPFLPWTSFAFLVWALFGKLTGLKHPPVRGPAEDLTPRRKFFAVACLAILLLTFMPSPAWLDAVH